MTDNMNYEEIKAFYLATNFKNYQNVYQCGKIYGIQCNKTKKLYIGSTVFRIEERLWNHLGAMSSYYKGGNGSCYCTSYEVLKNKDYKIRILESYPCENLHELLKREGQWQDKFPCVNKILNKGFDRKVINCPCGGFYTNSNSHQKKAHEASQRHQSYTKIMNFDPTKLNICKLKPIKILTL